jgi:hypothetical protein
MNRPHQFVQVPKKEPVIGSQSNINTPHYNEIQNKRYSSNKQHHYKPSKPKGEKQTDSHTNPSNINNTNVFNNQIGG